MDETALFFKCVRGVIVVNQMDVFSVLQKPEEMVGNDGIPIMVGGQVEMLLQAVHNQRVLAAPLGENVLVDRQHDDVFEVKGTGFQKSHDLQTAVGRTAQRYGQFAKLLGDNVFDRFEV